MNFDRLDLTYKSHFYFDYNGNGSQFRRNSEETWTVRYGNCERPVQSFKQECFNAAKLIFDQFDDEIWVLFSGGVDSEVTLRSFVESGLPVNAAIARYKNDINLHDISWAVIACEKLGVNYKFFDLDLIKFWEEFSMDYGRISQCLSPQLIVSMWLVDQVDGIPVLGSGECLLVRDDENMAWSLWEKERVASWYRFFISRQRKGCPGFFQYTPELILSYIQDPFIQPILNNCNQEIVSSEQIKQDFYREHFDIIKRPKYTGFEKVQAEDSKYRNHLKKLYGASDNIVKTSIEVLKQKLQHNNQN